MLGELREAGGDRAVDRDVDDRIALERGDQRERAGLAGVPLEHAFALERAEVIHGGGLARKAEVLLDFAGRWSHSALLLRGGDEGENQLLADG